MIQFHTSIGYMDWWDWWDWWDQERKWDAIRDRGRRDSRQ